LISVAIGSVVTAGVMTLALSARQVFEQDQRRSTVNQNLRSGMGLLGIDVRQAGERMPGDAPAVEVVNGSSGAPDALVLRRNLLDYVLPLCKDINAGSSADSVFVGKKKITGSVPPGCSPVPDTNSDGWPDNMEAWREYRIANGGRVLAYIHNPVTGNGEFFTYDAEDNSTFHIHKANPGNWQYDYVMNQQPRIYIIEQKRYLLNGDTLQCVLNENTSAALNLVNHIRDFQVRALLDDGTVLTSMTSTTKWTRLYALEIRLDGSEAFGLRDIDRTLVSRFFPRNILSN
jgi:type IV pilus assembly protein PilW